MPAAIGNLIIQLIAGAIGGNATGKSLPNYNLGTVGNTIAGAIGGVAAGQILQSLIPALSAAGSGLNVGAIVGQLVAGVASGAILTFIVIIGKSMLETITGECGED